MPIPSEFEGWHSRRFMRAVEAGELEQAKAWLNYVRNHREDYPQYDGKDNVLSDRERELIRAYRNKGKETGEVKWYSEAKLVIESGIEPEHIKNRRRRLEDVSGLKYDEIP